VLKLSKLATPHEQLNTESDSIDLLSVYRSMLRIIARLGESEYTGRKLFLHQTIERELDDLADPASEGSTSQG
jgi:hypothetical protein